MIRQHARTTPPIPPGSLAVSAWSRSTTILAVCALVAVCCTPWYKLNLTSSAPRGVWLLHRVPAVVERGMWVTLPGPDAVERWLPRWIPLLKPVAAVAGERVCVKEETSWIRGASYGRVYVQAQGQPLPHLVEGCFEVEAGRVFLAGTAANSLDSRYFGTVPVSVLTAWAVPLWTWR